MKKKIFLIIYTFSLLLLTSCVTSVDSRHTEVRSAPHSPASSKEGDPEPDTLPPLEAVSYTHLTLPTTERV